MANPIEFYQIDAFTNQPFSGNPAAVIFSNNLTDKKMQQIAAEMNLSETAFLSDSNVADYKLRWFTPTTEVDLCGHATIASLHFLHQSNMLLNQKEIYLETKSGILKCYRDADKNFMQIPYPKLEEFNGCKEDILDALNIDRVDVSDLPFILSNNGYLFIAINSLKALWNLNPDFIKLKNLSNTIKEFFDVAVFTIDTIENKSSAHLRFFAPYHGINEDPVTGSACGPLLPVLIKLGVIASDQDNHTFIFEQGDVLERSGRVFVNCDSKKSNLFIAGEAVTVMKGNLLV